VAVGASAFAQVPCDYPLKPPRGHNLDPANVVARYTNYIFRIFAGRSQGTAFAIDPASGYFLTAQHVVNHLDQDGIIGDLDSQPERKFKFEVVMKLCKHFVGDECKNDDGGYDPDPGVDVALLKMSGDDLKDYISMLGSAQASFDLSLSLQPPDEAYKAGFPVEGNPEIEAVLHPSDKMSVVRDFGIGDRPLKHRQWTLDRTASPGESGSPVMDGSENIFAILIEQDPSNANNGISINLLEAMESLKKVFKEMPRTEVGSRLSLRIAKNQYKSAAEVARDLRPGSITNKELAAVILDVTEHGPPPFPFKHCPVDIALTARGLDGIFGAWENDEAKVDPNQRRTVLFRDANGLLASGQLEAAADRYEHVLDLKSAPNMSARDSLVLESALGAARIYQLINEPEKEMKYSEIALRLAYKQGSKEHIALASTYRYNAALALDNGPSALRNAKTSFIQAPGAMYANLASPEDKEKFRVITARKLSVDEWQSFMNVQQTALEDKLLDAPAGKALNPTIQ
jgi:hypothetical protein